MADGDYVIGDDVKRTLSIVPPSNNVITSFLSTLIGQPHFGAEGPRNASRVTRRTFPYVGGAAGHETKPYVVSFPDPAPLRGKEGLGTLVDFLGILCVSNHVTHAYAHAHFSNKRVIREVVPRGRGLGSRHT